MDTYIQTLPVTQNNSYFQQFAAIKIMKMQLSLKRRSYKYNKSAVVYKPVYKVAICRVVLPHIYTWARHQDSNVIFFRIITTPQDKENPQ